LRRGFTRSGGRVAGGRGEQWAFREREKRGTRGLNTWAPSPFIEGEFAKSRGEMKGTRAGGEGGENFGEGEGGGRKSPGKQEF